jgi:peptidoglycan-N-acetylglucosamine deacetylase
MRTNRSYLLAVSLLLLLMACNPQWAQTKPNLNKTMPPAKNTPATNTASPASDLQIRLAAFWSRAKEESYRSTEELLAQHNTELRRCLHYAKLIRGDQQKRDIALTFDDGPHPAYTPQLLAILKRYDVKATFFVVGEMALKNPELIRAEKAAGHELGNHTFHHVNLTKIPISEVAIEWQACQDAIKSITGDTMRFCRPPGGDYDAQVIQSAMALHLTTVLWTDDPGDYASPGAQVIEVRILAQRNIENGGIILLHDGVQQTVDVLPQIIENLRARGFRFVTLSQMQTDH